MTTKTLIATPDPESTHDPITGRALGVWRRQPTVEDLLDLRTMFTVFAANAHERWANTDDVRVMVGTLTAKNVWLDAVRAIDNLLDSL
jgi:hypothetical protein